MVKQVPLRIRVFITTAISSLIPLLLAITILHFSFIQSLEEQIASEALDIANLVANDKTVLNAYNADFPSLQLQPLAKVFQDQTKAAFVVFMDMHGTRYSHPNEDLIGLPFTGGDEGPALHGESYTSKAVGISGPSIRAFSPIYSSQNIQIGAVAVGFFKPDISRILSSRIYKTTYLVIPLALLLVIFFSIVLANNIKNLMFGLEPLEIATLLKERDTMLQSVKEGIIAIDADSKITVINQAAQNIFPPGTDFIGRNITDLIPDSQLPQVMDTLQTQQDMQILINDNVVLTNRIPLIISGKVMGAIATFRPLTEVNRIAEELTGVKKIMSALRARTHEFLNKLHVVSGLIQLEAYDEARKYISNLTYKEHSFISFLIDHIHSSAIVGLLMGKASEASERQIQFNIQEDSRLFALPEYFDEHAMIIVLGNLIENAFDAVMDNRNNRNVNVLIKQDTTEIQIEVVDSGPGIPPLIKKSIFEPGFTNKANGQGFGLANAKNRVDVARGTLSFSTGPAGTLFRVKIPFNLM